MIYLISIILLSLCLIKRNSKKLFVIMMIWMWVLIAFNTNRADYSMYIQLYDKYSNASRIYDAEILFQILCKIGGFFKLNYFVFYALYNIIPIVLIGISINKLSKNVSFVAGCYFIFPFALDAVQMRHFIAVALVTYGMTFLLDVNEDKKNIFKYIVFNILAIGFHYSAAFFLLLPLVKNKKNNLIILVIFIVVMVIFVIYTEKLTDILQIFASEGKIEAYFSRDRWKIDFEDSITVMFFQILILPFIYFMEYVYNIHTKHVKDNDETAKDKNMIENVLKFDWIMMILLPTYIYNMELMRVFRGILLINIIISSNVLVKTKTKDNLIVIMTVLIFLFVYLWFLIIHVGTWQTTIRSLLEYNAIFNIRI